MKLLKSGRTIASALLTTLFLLAAFQPSAYSQETSSGETTADAAAGSDAAEDLGVVTLKKGNKLRRMFTPNDADPMISTDRNSVTPHPNAVPLGFLQVESGITLDKLHRGGDYVLPETVVRLGTWRMGELRFQVPNLFQSFGFDGRQVGTTDIQVSVKQEIEPHWLRSKGIDLGVIAGMSIPTGTKQVTTGRVDPFVQMIAFQKIGKNYTLGTSHSIFMPSEAIETEEIGVLTTDRKVTYQPTVILFRALGDRVDIWGEYAAQFFERGPSLQLMDFGGVWRPRKRHQVDFRFGFGLTNAAPRAFIGTGYSVLIGKLLPFPEKHP